MKSRKKVRCGALAGSVLLASSILSGCVRPLPAPVYGPPPDDDTEPFHAEENLPDPVYGPGPDFDPEYDTGDTDPGEADDTSGQPENEEPPADDGTEVQH